MYMYVYINEIYRHIVEGIAIHVQHFLYMDNTDKSRLISGDSNL